MFINLTVHYKVSITYRSRIGIPARYALFGRMHCLVVCTVWSYALFGRMHCLVVCTVWSYALFGRMHCLVVCTVWSYALFGCDKEVSCMKNNEVKPAGAGKVRF